MFACVDEFHDFPGVCLHVRGGCCVRGFVCVCSVCLSVCVCMYVCVRQ